MLKNISMSALFGSSQLAVTKEQQASAWCWHVSMSMFQEGTGRGVLSVRDVVQSVMLADLDFVMGRDWLRTTICSRDGQANSISLVLTIWPGRTPGLPVPLRQRCPGSMPAADMLLQC